MCHDCKAKKNAPAKKSGSGKGSKGATTSAQTQQKKQAKGLQEGSQSCADIDDTSGDNGTNSGGLIMIDTTKTANQKRKEAALARRTEKAL